MSSRPLTFQLPIPDRALSPNARIHWAVRSKAVQTARKMASVEARRVLGDAKMSAPGWPKVSYRIVWFHRLAKRPDPDNAIATLKAYLDGIADVGVMLNDRDAWPERPEFRKAERMPRVEITVTPEL